MRNYRFLNLKFLCLNCSSRATPYRTNKVGVNRDIVLGLTKRAIWTEKSGIVRKEKIPLQQREPHRICVTHYSPEYKLSYFQDCYGTLPGWVWSTDEDTANCSPVNDLEKRFRRMVVKAYELRLNKPDKGEDVQDDEFESEKTEFLRRYQSMMDAIHALEERKQCPNKDAQEFYNHLKSKNPKDQPSFSEKKYRLLRYIGQFCEWIQAEDKNAQDESFAQFLKEAAEHITMGEIDSTHYKELIGDIHGEHPLTLILAGHIHAYSEPVLKVSSEKPSIPILVSDKLLNESNGDELNGYLIEFAAPSNDVSSNIVFTHSRLSEV